MPPTALSRRDLRLDLFRGIALWLIFLDHIPSNVVNWITIRNYGFSDATEIFVFISGYTAAFVYGRAMEERGPIVAGARILKRAWQVYVAHIFIFVIFMAEIAYLTRTIENPLYTEEMGALDFLKEPGSTLIQALLLKFKPNFMDVLPLYIVLLIVFPPVLWLLLRAPTVALAGSVLVYAVSWEYGLNLPSYPTGRWFFNPLAWQLLFVFGAWCAVGGLAWIWPFLRSRVALGLAIAYLALAFLIVMTWYFPRYAVFIPKAVQDWMYPIDKTNMDVLRFIHFLALALVTVRFIPVDWPGLTSPFLRPMILCGQHSLEIFCLGIFLSFLGHFITSEVSRSIAMQVLISVLGILTMIAVASVLSWYKNIAGRAGPRPKPPDPDPAGGAT
jgi:hypothetical protein